MMHCDPDADHEDCYVTEVSGLVLVDELQYRWHDNLSVNQLKLNEN